MKDLGSKDSQIILDLIESRDLQERCIERWAGEANDLFLQHKERGEHDESGFTKVSIINVVNSDQGA